MSVKIDFLFEPALLSELTSLARLCQAEQRKADAYKWSIAKRVNFEWPEYEHMTIEGEQAFNTKMDYYREMSVALNKELPINLFGESGQTMRFYCELQSTFANTPNAEVMLKATSIDTFRRAKRLAKDNKVVTDSGQLAGADYAIAKAIENKWSAEDMEQHFDPKQSPTEYDKWSGAMSVLLDMDNYQWIQSAEVKEQIFTRVQEIEVIKKNYLDKKGLAE